MKTLNIKTPVIKYPVVKINSPGVGVPKRPRVFGAKKSNFNGESYYNKIFKKK